jgi:chromosome partitioning protein
MGYRVFLLDLDVYAPSLQSYFEKDPKKWINDFLFENAELEEVVLDFTPLINSPRISRTSNNAGIKSSTKRGQLWVGFCNTNKEEIYKFEMVLGKKDRSQIKLFRRLIHLRELLTSEYNADYIIIDTSPGIRYWSIHALVVADILFLTLKMSDLDIVGTRELATEIYASLRKFGAISFLLLNRVSGYCLPHRDVQRSTAGLRTTVIGTSIHQSGLKPRSSLVLKQQAIETDIQNFLTNETGMKVLSGIPCYCDIQFSRKEFLTVLSQPEHLFAKQLEQLVHAIETI